VVVQAYRYALDPTRRQERALWSHGRYAETGHVTGDTAAGDPAVPRRDGARPPGRWTQGRPGV